MKSYLSLIPISARVRKKQNRMTIICIMLAVFLVTAVFSMADMTIRAEEASAKRQHGNWHIMLSNISAADAQTISMRPDVAAFSEYRAINYNIKEDYYVGGKKAAIVGTDKTWLTDIFDYMTEGQFPANENEAVISENARDILGAGIGDRVTLRTPAGNFEYTISGFEHDGGSSLYDAIILCVDMTAFERLRTANDKAPAPEYYCRFNRHVNVRRAINEIKAQLELKDDEAAENTVMVGLTGFSENNILQSMYAVAVFLFLLILTAGVLMIAGSMNSSISQRTKFFGMLRCSGASKKQIIRLVRLEALNWCKTAVPAGIVGGVAITWALCAVLKLGVGGEFADMPLFGISAVGIVCGALVGIITVLIAARSPAGRAAAVSPAAAVSGDVRTRVRHAANTKFMKIETALGVHHAVSSKKNLLLMTGSFALSIILFLGFSAVHDWTRHALNGLQPHTPDLSVLSGDPSGALSCGITHETADRIASMPGVKRAFGRSFKGGFKTDCGKGVEAVDLVSLDEVQFNYADEERWTEDNAGLERVRTEDGCVMTVYDKDNPLEKGDKLVINGKELEIACILTDSPIGGSGSPTVICSEKIFKSLTGETGYAVFDIQLEKDVSESDIRSIRSEAEANGFHFSDRRENNREIVGTYWAFTVLSYGFLSLIAMIAVFNIMNSISMSVSARLRQYGIMRSVGMSAVQITRMIGAETSTYTLCGLLCGLAAGLPIHKSFYEGFVTAYFGEAWEPPVAGVIIITAFVTAASTAAVYAPAKRIKNMSVAEVISNE